MQWSLKRCGERDDSHPELYTKGLNEIEELRVEVVDPELVEVAEDDVGRALRNDVRPVVERLVVVLFEMLATRLHLNQHAVGARADLRISCRPSLWPPVRL